MSAEQQAGTRVEMAYRATIEDFREALRARCAGRTGRVPETSTGRARCSTGS
ncbi:hypothetical protein [Streptomyces albofaciens]|uniref:hypothetical protein n=1 Tax=Streptomyces albofaciens TaxID=66866 RepID=UPI00142EF1C2|nr:hypothetical protein [Streptomyces albofaciens]